MPKPSGARIQTCSQKVLGSTRSLADAEDACTTPSSALVSWRNDGAPTSAEAWLITVAGNSHRDQLRRAQGRPHAGALERLAQLSPWARIALAEPEMLRGWKDELLRLLFACCHPALEDGESAASALSTAQERSARL